MHHDTGLQTGQGQEGAAAETASSKQPWQEPKLTFVEPTLTAHGPLAEVTGAVPGFFTTFTPR
jgi:hypothetical protein